MLSDHLRPLVSLPLEPGLVSTATQFLLLQDARHAADYDVSQNFTRLEVLDVIRDAQTAFDD